MSMRILVQPGSYSCLNFGDVAMCQVGVRRLSTIWPGAEVQIITTDPESLGKHCPEAFPIPYEGFRDWLQARTIFTDFCRRFSGRMAKKLEGLEKRMWLQSPDVGERCVRWKQRIKGSCAPWPALFHEQLQLADLVVLSGMGGLNDSFKDSALCFLDLLEAAISRKIATAILGQGIGPLRDPELRSRMKQVLPRVDLVALRESRTSLPLLADLGVPSSRMFVTGDDAVELAFENRSRVLGNCIGINFRLAHYAQMDSDDLVKIREVLVDVVNHLRVPLAPVVISRNPVDSDAKAIRSLMDYPGFSWSGDLEHVQTADLVRQIGQCRLVVTGSYHGAVFALSQGIPAVCLARSDYYADKFFGLQKQFGDGCSVVVLDRSSNSSVLCQAIVEHWSSADQLRAGLLAAAKDQIDKGYLAYKSLSELPSLKASRDSKASVISKELSVGNNCVVQ